jgi:predicted ATP-dependent serine protease
VIIGQVNKAGDFAGKQGVKHHVDTHSHLEIDMNKKSDFYGFRIFENQKNRFGTANVRHALSMDASGLQLNAIIE